MIGEIFNNWEVISPHGRKLLVQCLECGKEYLREKKDIVTGKSKSCRKCYSKKRAIKNLKGHIGVFGNASPTWKGTKDIPYDYFSQCKRGAASRNIEFKLKIEDLQNLWDSQKGKCKYTGRDLCFKVGRNRRRGRHDADSKLASLDRIDSSKPYTSDNIQFLSAPINLMKGTYSEEEFLNLVKEIKC